MSEETKPFSVPFIADSYMFAGSGSHGSRIWADLDFLPGEHESDPAASFQACQVLG